MAKLSYLFVVLALLLAVGLAVLHRIENPKTKYDKYQAVVADDAIGRGWIPSFLPESATDITEQHSIDTNVGYVTFTADLVDVRAIRADCAPTDLHDVTYLPSYPMWWPMELREPTPSAGKFRFFQCSESETLISLDDRIVYYWHSGE